MLRARPIRVIIVVGLILDLAAVALVVGLHERAAAQARSDKRAERYDQVDAGMNTIQSAIFAWSEANGRTWPPAEEVTPDSMSGYLRDGTPWPVNPFDGRPMHQGTGPGDYQYLPAGAKTKAGFGAYTLTGTFRDGRPLGYVIIGGAGPMRAQPTSGTAIIEGYTTGSGGGQTDGGPNVLTGISVEGLVCSNGATKWGPADLSLNGRTRMFDASGVEVPRADQYSYEGKVYYWRAIARKTAQGWVALKLQALVTWENRT